MGVSLVFAVIAILFKEPDGNFSSDM